MILAYHVIFGTYGFWLPNDPRGSWSQFVGSWELSRFGKATTVSTRRSLAHDPHDHEQRRAAKKSLKFPAVSLTGRQALAVAQGFDRARQEAAYVLHACAILPEHVHLVVGRHKRPISKIVGHLKGRATLRLAENPTSGFRDDRPLWSKRAWRVFLRSPAQICRAIEYVEQNPVKEGKRPQRWSFVTPYE